MENAITHLSLVAVLIVMATVITNVAYVFSLPGRVPREAFSIGLVWFVMLLGMGQWFERESGVTTLTTVDTSASIQIASISVALLTLLLYLGKSFSAENLKFPFLLVFIFASVGLLLSPIAPFPALSAFKALSLVTSTLLAVVAIQKLSKAQAPMLLYNIVFVYFSVLVVLALIGGVFFPEITHKPSGGVFGYMLVGWPSLNPNSLSYVSAVVLVISLHRFFLERLLNRKLLFMGVCIAAAFTLMLAQGRTSLGGAFIAILFMSFAVREMKIMRYVIGGMSFLVLSLLLVTGTVGDWVGGLEEYLRRGVSDEQLSTLSGRTEAWELSWELFKDSPLVGYGFYAAGKVLVAPHNAYFTVLLNVGLLGFLPWLVGILAGFIKISLQYTKQIVRNNSLACKYHKEIFAVMMVQFLRTVTGQDLSVHSYSFLLFFSALVYVYAWERSSSVKSVIVSEPLDERPENSSPSDQGLPVLKRKTLS